MALTLNRIKQLLHLTDKPDLADEQTSKLGSLKTEYGTHPARGLTPAKLAQILEAAEQGDLIAQADLFSDMEERDAHLFSELSKRRRSVLGLDWSLTAPRDATAAEQNAATELEAHLRDALDMEHVIWELTDAIGKGFAALEIDWQRHKNGWHIQALQPRPQRWFTVAQFDRNDLRLRDPSAPYGAELWPLGWVVHRHAATAGWLAENALMRVLAWPYLFKNYSVRDLAEFLEIYGLPLRLGKYPNGATKQEKMTLMRAVMNIGHAAAGVVPQGMEISFEKAADGHADPFEAMIAWAEASISKAIVGQTLTAQSGANGEGSRALGEVHDKVRRDITVSDARQLQPTLTRQLVLPVGLLNGYIADPERAPRFLFETTETEDIGVYASSLPKLVNMGMQIPVHWAHERLGIPEAGRDEETLQPAMPARGGLMPLRAALKSETPDAAPLAPEQLLPIMRDHMAPQSGDWIERIRDLAHEVDSTDELMDRLLTLYPQLTLDDYAEAFTQATLVSDLAGRHDVTEER